MAYIGSAVSKPSDIKRITFATSTTGSGPFALGWEPDSEASLRVTINGVTQQGSDITISGSNLTIAETLVSGDELEVVGIVHTGGQNIPMDGSVTVDKMARAGTSGEVLTSAGAGADATWSPIVSTGSISKTDSYTVTAADIVGVGHLSVYVDSSGGTNPLTIHLPTAAVMSGMFITVWVATFDKEVKVYKSDSSIICSFNAVDDYVTVTSDGTKYLTYVLDFTAGGGATD